MGLNIDELQNLNQEVAKGSGGMFMNQQDIDGELDVRLPDPLGNMNGKFYLWVKRLWINKKPYISPETFGEHCPMTEVLDDALASGDKDVEDMVKSLCYKGDLNSLWDYRYQIPIWPMKQDDNGKFLRKPEEKAKLLETSYMLWSRILDVVAHRNYMGELENGDYYDITHPQFGSIITLQRKEGRNNRNDYNALGGPQLSLPAWCNDPKNIPDVVTMTMKQMKSDEYLRSVIENYLYGESLVEEEERYTEKEIEESQKLAKAKEYPVVSEEEEEKPKKPAKPKKKEEPEEEEEEKPKKPSESKEQDEEEEEKPKKKAKKEEEGEEEEEEKPKPKKKKASQDEEEEEEKPKPKPRKKKQEDEEEKPKKKPQKKEEPEDEDDVGDEEEGGGRDIDEDTDDV